MNFFFGKDPEIFDNDGQVSHNFPKKKWDDWKNRYIKSDDYNWRTHAGTKAGAQTGAPDDKTAPKKLS